MPDRETPRPTRVSAEALLRQWGLGSGGEGDGFDEGDDLDDLDAGDDGGAQTARAEDGDDADDAGRGGEVGGPQRLQKVLARVGIGSRRACEELILAGRVLVNGRRAELGQRVDVTRDTVEVDGVRVGIAPDAVHYLLNKPAGVVTTAADPQGRPTVVDLVPAEPRVFPVGRLDAETEGLLLLTNDGELAFRLTHPSYGVAKEYLVWVEGRPGAAALRSLRSGVDLNDGRTAPAKVGQQAPDLLTITVHEGRNRQVRRMCEAVGHPVRRLVRVRIGPLTDSSLRPGQWRPLTSEEVRSLEILTAQPSPGPGAASRSGGRPPRPGGRPPRQG
jgi:23S rRNA pseudouridine2605 synthase